MSFPAEKRNRLIQVAIDAEDCGLDLSELLAEAKKRPIKPAASPTLSAMMTELFSAKRSAGISERYLQCLAVPLKQFMAGREESPVAAVQFEDVERFVHSVNPASRSTVRARLSTLFNFAVRRGHLVSNPCARLEAMAHRIAPPAIFTVDQVHACLNHFENHPRLLAWFALSCFAGLRPEEADRSQWSAIDFTAGLIRVEGQTSKTGQRRVIYPQPMALAWLRHAKDLGGELPLQIGIRLRLLRQMRPVLGMKKWPKDITRHTAASYWLAASDSVAAVATSLGNSEGILRKHYLALVTRAEAERFWSVMPPAV